MGTWGTELEGNDTFADIYDDFFEAYDRGLSVPEVTKKLMAENRETIEEPEDSDNFWFALAKAQWECKALDTVVFQKVKDIVVSGYDLKVWKDLGASEADLQERKAALDQFLKAISVEVAQAKPRNKPTSPAKPAMGKLSDKAGKIISAVLVLVIGFSVFYYLTYLGKDPNGYFVKNGWPVAISLFLALRIIFSLFVKK